MNKEVTICDNCPLLQLTSTQSYWCNHSANERYLDEDDKGRVVFPKDCPLKTEPITISLKQD